jgi:serine/threonine-protein kinase
MIAYAAVCTRAKGIVHRDLKPANIKITPEGTLKVLDFGLAKAAVERTASRAESPTMSPTVSLEMTQVGMILGTAEYMSPEQARGKPIDKRADIWAFGVVLYEMLTGERMFRGETVSDTLIEVATREPDWTRVPERVRRLLERCLEKDPRKRLRDTGDAWDLLDVGPRTELGSPPNRSSAWIVATGALAIALAALAVTHFRARPADLPVLRFALMPPEGAAFGHTFGSLSAFAVSPDGRRLAFVAHSAGGKDQLWVRTISTLSAQPLAGTEGASYPFWSPDSRFIGFGADGKLKKIDANGGPAVTLAVATSFRGGTWNGDDVILFTDQTNGYLRRVSFGRWPISPRHPARRGENGAEPPLSLVSAGQPAFPLRRADRQSNS